MTDPLQSPMTPKARPWLRWVLIVSVTLNLLAVGLIGGAMVRFGGLPKDVHRGVAAGVAIFRELPRELRREVQGKARKTMAHPARTLRSETQSILSLLRADELDVQALTTLMQDRTSRRAAFEKVLQDGYVSAVEQMTLEQRRAYADRVEQALSRKRRGDHDD